MENTYKTIRAQTRYFYERDEINFHLQQCKNEIGRKLQSLSNVLNETNQVLENVRVDVTVYDPILAYVAIEKLPKETRSEFKKSIGRKQELPTFKYNNNTDLALHRCEFSSKSTEWIFEYRFVQRRKNGY